MAPIGHPTDSLQGDKNYSETFTFSRMAMT